MATQDNRNPQQIHLDNLLEVERHLQELQDFITSIKDATFGHVKLRIGGHIQQDMRWIAAQTGNVTAIEGGTTTDLLKQEGPKKIMGKEVGSDRAPVTAGMVAPGKKEKEKFAANVTDLYNGFLGLKDKDVFAIMSKPGGDTLVRGVAKKAGVAGWDSRDTSEIDITFFADIRDGIKANAKISALSEDINKKLADEDETEEEEETAPKKKSAAKKSAPIKKAVASKKSAAKKSAASILDEEEE